MEHKKCCELCGVPARMYCESDQASLCWDCDERVHSANFLVAKHSRSLLCHVCQSPTPWAAAGPKLGPTVSVCDGCFDTHGKHPEAVELEEEYSVNDRGVGDDDHSDEDEELRDEDGDESDDYDDDEEEEEDEEDGENQVVPWSCDSPLPPEASSSSSEEESAGAVGGGCLGLGPKRVWDVAFSNDSDDEIGCASSQGISRALAATKEGPSTSASLRPLKQQRLGVENSSLPTGDKVRGVVSESKSKLTSAAIIESLKRLQRSAEGNSAAAVLGIRRLS